MVDTRWRIFNTLLRLGLFQTLPLIICRFVWYVIKSFSSCYCGVPGSSNSKNSTIKEKGVSYYSDVDIAMRRLYLENYDFYHSDSTKFLKIMRNFIPK